MNFVKRKITQFSYIMMKCNSKRLNFRLHVYSPPFKEELCMEILENNQNLLKKTIIFRFFFTKN